MNDEDLEEAYWKFDALNKGHDSQRRAAGLGPMEERMAFKSAIRSLEKEAGGDILARMAGLVSRPFVGAARSQAVQNSVSNGVTNYVNRPLEGALRRTGVHKAISKVYEHGTRPIPGTPRLVQPVMHDPVQRRAYGNWRADDLVHTFANNPEIVGALAVPLPGAAETYLAGKHLVGKAIGAGAKGGIKKVASYSPAPTPGFEKTAEVYPYQQKTQWTCSAACLKAVLAHWGMRVPELVAIEAVGAQKGRGAETDQIADAARKFGFAAFEYSFESIDQAKVLLDQDIPIICDIQSFNNPGKGHYVVMVSADEQRVQLMDPNTPGNWRVISRAEMTARWWDRTMAPPHDMMWKWGIIVVPSEEESDGGE